jgi:aryl carrier-like protein
MFELHDHSLFVKEINTMIFLVEESLRNAIAADLRSLGAAHPELAAWAETLARRYARGEESK